MAEYIEREAVIDLITRRYENPEICTQEINSIPAADVAPVTRCEKCEYVRAKVNIHTGEQVGVWCYLWDEIDIGADDYCSRGKPREAVT